MRIHFIAIGGAVMHNLAIALHKKGDHVSGSDDEIFDPAQTNLSKYSLLPEKIGWDAARITGDIDFIILGMHARENNPELIKAKELGLVIKSFPEFLYEQTKNKTRIVVGGSHGKTTITSIIMHVLRVCNIEFDYMVGSSIDGFETMVSLSGSSDIAVFEGDEYLTSTLDRRPKFHLYNPDIAIISGIAWDHINVFPDYNEYVNLFRIFAEKITKGGTLIYYSDDPEVSGVAEKVRPDIIRVPYSVHRYKIEPGGFIAVTDAGEYPLHIFGEHNMQNISAAKEAVLAAGISEADFYNAIKDFKGSARRLQLIRENETSAFYLDFAHAPSKVKATVDAVSARYPSYKLIVCYELHTFSSLSETFLDQYKNTLEKADVAYIYFNPHAIKLKNLYPLREDTVIKAFGKPNLIVLDDSEAITRELSKWKNGKNIFLLMSSGDFNGTNINQLARQLVQ